MHAVFWAFVIHQCRQKAWGKVTVFWWCRVPPPSAVPVPAAAPAQNGTAEPAAPKLTKSQAARLRKKLREGKASK